MRFRKLIPRVGIVSILLGLALPALGQALAASAPQLVISQFKITSSSGQFVTLYNQSDSTIDLSQYEVDYLNSASKLSSIPISGQLAAHSFYMLNDDQVRLCYQVTLDSVSLGFATTSGTLQIWQTSADKSSKQLQDSVSWTTSKTVPAGSVALPAQNAANTVSLLRQPTDSLGNPQLAAPGSGSWQAVAPDAANPCSLDIINTTTVTPSPTSNPGNQLGIGPAPPATIINLTIAGSSDDSPVLPSADIGLNAPQLTELLPNPDGTGNDGTDEFIELYNPNPTAFHLVGFTLQTGSTTKHNYTFPDATILPPQSFTAFYSRDTGLSLSNSGGQADLLDPFGNVLTQTDTYDTAKDGLAWALASGKWYWTTQPTPNAANIVKQVTSTSKSTKKKSSTSKATSRAVKGASTASSGSGSADTSADDTTPPPVHPYVLAAVAALAVGYGVYEYRHDLGNLFHQFRRHRAARRAAGA